jgi:hypothetical protein
VTHVVDYDLPQNAEEIGKAITLSDEVFVMGLEPLKRMLGYKIPVEWPDSSSLRRAADGCSVTAPTCHRGGTSGAPLRPWSAADDPCYPTATATPPVRISSSHH